MDNETTKIYVVMGTSGEYSDRNEWAVVAYTIEKDARRHVYLASAAAREIYLISMRTKKDWREIKNIYDPHMEGCDAQYFYYTVELSSTSKF